MGFLYFSLSGPSQTASCKQDNHCDFRKSGESFFIWITRRFSGTSWESEFRKSLHYSKRYLKNLGLRNVFTTVQLYYNTWQMGNLEEKIVICSFFIFYCKQLFLTKYSMFKANLDGFFFFLIMSVLLAFIWNHVKALSILVKFFMVHF